MVAATACSTDIDHAGVQSEPIAEAIKSLFQFKTRPPKRQLRAQVIFVFSLMASVSTPYSLSADFCACSIGFNK